MKKLWLILVLVLVLVLLFSLVGVLGQDNLGDTRGASDSDSSVNSPTGGSNGEDGWTSAGISEMRRVLNGVSEDGGGSKEAARAMLNKNSLIRKLPESVLDLAVEKKVITEREKFVYLHNRGIFGFIVGNFEFVQDFVGTKIGRAIGLNPLKVISPANSIFAFLFLVWLILFHPFTFIRKKGKMVWKYYYKVLGFSLFSGLLAMYFGGDKRYCGDYHFFRFSNWRLWIPFVYIISLFVPVLNRTVQIITLEFLPTSIIIRSFLIAFVVSLAPSFVQRFNEYRRRVYEEEAKLREETLHEISKLDLR